jgi:TCP-1/cpn60 chaperonin family
MENQIVVNDYRQMDKILKEERTYLLNMCKKIKKTGCNVLLIQKSILRDAVNDLSLHFLSKLKILAIKGVGRGGIEFICKASLPPPPPPLCSCIVLLEFALFGGDINVVEHRVQTYSRHRQFHRG